jgi:SAM-dependent methyltransferase
MAEYNEVYQRAYYYDILFRRDTSRETGFLRAVYDRFVGRRLLSVLELACGPGYHVRDFCRQGIRAIGLDLRPEMLEFAHDQSAAEGVYPEWLASDMRSFQLAEPVDLVFNIFDGLDCLLTNEDIIRHLQVIAANLTDQGLYVIDLTHPRDCCIARYDRFRYQGERDGVAVDLRWAVNDPQPDWLTGVSHTEIEMHVRNIHTDQTQVIRDFARERLLVPQEIQLLAACSGAFEIVGWYGDFDVDQPFDYSPAARRMITVMQKR